MKPFLRLIIVAKQFVSLITRKLPIPRPCLCQRTEEPRKSRRSRVRALNGCDKHYMGVREFPHNSMRHKR
jgi:hypothetical protein